MRLDIAADGTVADVEFLPGFYDDAVLRQLEEPLEALQFQPATAGGAPVAFPKLNVRVLLRGPNPPEVSENLREALVELATLVNNKDLPAAERFAVNLLDDEATRLFELAVLEDQLSAIYAEAGQVPEAIVASRLATSSSNVVLPPDGPAADTAYPETFLTPQLHFDAQRCHLLYSLLADQTGEAL